MATKAEDLSARNIEQEFIDASAALPDLLVSADSHIDEPEDLWNELPKVIQEQLPPIRKWTPENRPQGGVNPEIRIEHMDLDNVAAEVLYPTSTLRAFNRPQGAVSYL